MFFCRKNGGRRRVETGLNGSNFVIPLESPVHSRLARDFIKTESAIETLSLRKLFAKSVNLGQGKFGNLKVDNTASLVY